MPDLRIALRSPRRGETSQFSGRLSTRARSGPSRWPTVRRYCPFVVLSSCFPFFRLSVCNLVGLPLHSPLFRPSACHCAVRLPVRNPCKFVIVLTVGPYVTRVSLLLGCPFFQPSVCSFVGLSLYSLFSHPSTGIFVSLLSCSPIIQLSICIFVGLSLCCSFFQPSVDLMVSYCPSIRM